MSPSLCGHPFLGLSSLGHNLFGLCWIPPLDSVEPFLGSPVGPGQAQDRLGYRKTLLRSWWELTGLALGRGWAREFCPAREVRKGDCRVWGGEKGGMAHGDIGPLWSGTAFVVRTVGCLSGPGWGWGSRVGTIPGPTQSIAGLGNRTSLRCPKLGTKP